MCLRSWKVHNPSWKIIELNDKILESYIQIDNEITNIHEKHITKTSFSDIVRIFLLEKYGGCWCDATTFCNMSLDLWLPKYTQGGFFAFEKPGGDRLLSTWFLYSEPRHYLTTAWKKATVKYWKTRAEVVDYFWFHHLFGELCKDDSIFSESWESTPKLSAHPPHYLQTNNLLSVPNKSTIDHIQGETPVYKLTYKFNESRYSDNCTLAYLKNTLKVNFIHIGKCGGTTIAHNFHLEGIHYHLERNYTDAGKFIIWVRNPLKRFVSAFNMAHDLIHADISTLEIPFDSG